VKYWKRDKEESIQELGAERKDGIREVVSLFAVVLVVSQLC